MKELMQNIKDIKHIQKNYQQYLKELKKENKTLKEEIRNLKMIWKEIRRMEREYKHIRNNIVITGSEMDTDTEHRLENRNRKPHEYKCGATEQMRTI